MRAILQACLGMVLAALPLSGPARAEVEPALRVKAAFLYNFAKFTTWPTSVTARGGPLGLCVLGDAGLAAALEAIEGKDVNGRPVMVRRLASPSDTEGCWMAFLPAGTSVAALRAMSRPGLLTVGDSPGFGRAGAVINLYLAGGKVRFEVNVAAAKRAEVSLSSKLLNLATIAEDDPR